MQKVSRNPVIRLAERSELGDVASLVADAFAPFERALPEHIFEPYLKDARDFAGRWDEENVAVVEQKGQFVGTVTYYADATREGMGWPSGLAGLRTLAVAPSVQGRGYGRALCEWCIGRARRQGAEGLALHTAGFMSSACKLYERLGFQRCDSYDLFASEVLGFDAALGDQKIIAYLLTLR